MSETLGRRTRHSLKNAGADDRRYRGMGWTFLRAAIMPRQAWE
jgi:hypothetical protein